MSNPVFAKFKTLANQAKSQKSLYQQAYTLIRAVNDTLHERSIENKSPTAYLLAMLSMKDTFTQAAMGLNEATLMTSAFYFVLSVLLCWV